MRSRERSYRRRSKHGPRWLERRSDRPHAGVVRASRPGRRAPGGGESQPEINETAANQSHARIGARHSAPARKTRYDRTYSLLWPTFPEQEAASLTNLRERFKPAITSQDGFVAAYWLRGARNRERVISFSIWESEDELREGGTRANAVPPSSRSERRLDPFA